ncbi:MAG: hypothetical protein KKH61_20640 [Gammaproteobacteria bacterium]|nr:hypothetical protein [Gammaproteobacteria bacterium]
MASKHQAELEVLELARNQEDENLAVYMLRDLEIVKDAGLEDYAWALYKDDWVCASDVDLLIEKLDEYLRSAEARNGDGKSD